MQRFGGVDTAQYKCLHSLIALTLHTLFLLPLSNSIANITSRITLLINASGRLHSVKFHSIYLCTR